MRNALLFFMMATQLTLIGISPGQSDIEPTVDPAIPEYYSHNDFLMASAGAYNDGLLGFANPANLSFLNAFDSRFFWTTEGKKAGTFDDWGLFLGAPHLGFGVLHKNYGDLKITDYRLSLGFGGDMFASGLGYCWSTSNNDNVNRERSVTGGMIVRPIKYLSIGMSGEWSVESGERQGVGEIGVRPLGNSRITLFGDLAMQKKTKFNEVPWSAGAVFEIVPGINLTGRFFDNESFTAGLTIDFGRDAISSQLHFDNDQKYAYNSYSVRLGGYRPSVFPELIDKEKRYLKIDLRGRMNYLAYRFGDSGRTRFMEVLKNIKAAGDDPRVAAIAINLADVRIAPEHAWEIREELKRFRHKGKKVVAFIEYADDRLYHLASVADVIVMDPTSIMGLAGYSLSRTYLKGTLEKLGLGFDEWRLFKYKSAAETFSRDSMSDADREQNQAYLDDWYELTRDDICQSRGMTIDHYEQIINSKVIYTSAQALEFGLVDKLGRWSGDYVADPESDVNKDYVQTSSNSKLVSDICGKKLRPIRTGDLLENALPPEYWGGDPKIAVVYALGDCAMDTGIRARWLSGALKKLSSDRSIKAIVFRVDSPGGEAMPSDLVADAVRDCAIKKPVIVSQGQVAASGGYMISAYGDEIIAGPNTITGSIGVMGGWIWDKGLSDKLGLSYDLVQRGDHADIFKGARLPFIDITVPGRNLTPDEREKVEQLILNFYNDFTAKIASGRNMTIDRVKEIGEGRFYSGIDGKDLDLVDEIGGLMLAIEIAKLQAGIPEDQRVELVEVPEYKGWFPFRQPFGMPGLATAVDEDDPAIKYIKMLNDSPLKALPMIPPGDYPTAE